MATVTQKSPLNQVGNPVPTAPGAPPEALATPVAEATAYDRDSFASEVFIRRRRR